MTDALAGYQENLQQFVALEAATEGHERSLPEAFASIVLDILGDAGEVDSPSVAPYEARGIRATAYEFSEEGDTLHLILADYNAMPSTESLTKSDVTTHFKRLATFADEASKGLWRDLEEAAPSWEMAKTLHDRWDGVAALRLTLVSNALLKTSPPPPSEIAGRSVRYAVWDLDRLHKLESSGRAQEPITIDVAEFWPHPIPCLGPQGEPGSYEAYLANLPGEFLAGVYGKYGPRLLELNVRSFLQSRGKVNKGIQDTINSEPERFFAYNNGVSMTASAVEVSSTPDGAGIVRIHDLQIVNGGQTTASLHHALVKYKADLRNVWVQAKLSVVEPHLLQDLVPRISRFANSQNRVNMADFTANDPFHVSIEKLSRTVWAPRSGGTQMSRWFYERARGQYNDAHARERTPAKQREFKKVHPPAQKFTKTDVAKFENTWDQLPWLVSFGAEKNFREFMLRLEKRGKFEPDQKYFERLIAKAVLVRQAEKLIGALQLGGYRAQTVTYTLAKIANATGQRIDLDSIWRNQALSDALSDAVVELAPRVHRQLVASAGSRNVTEWAKKEACWKEMMLLEWEPSGTLEREFVTSGRRTVARSESSLDEVLSDVEQDAADAVGRVSSDTWFALSSWAKETNNLQSWQRSLAFSLGRNASNGRAPSRKQAVQGRKILDEAERLGFKI